MHSDFMKETTAQFERDWENALDTSEWATVQISPRKVLVLRKPEVMGRGITGFADVNKGACHMRIPTHYKIVETCPNSFVAHDYIRRKIQEEKEERDNKSDGKKK
mgnify:CR=1 FL=1